MDTPAESTEDAGTIAAVRRFNRSFTQRIGVLDESFLSIGLPLAAARLLFEIGLDHDHGGVTVRELRARLGLDSGYVSRLLRQLEARELLELVGDGADARRRIVRLSVTGEAEWTLLDERSDGLVSALLGPLSGDERSALAQALTTADRLLGRASVSMELIDARSSSAREAMTAYFDELERRFDGGFDASGALDGDDGSFDPPAGCFVVLFDGDRPLGCGGVQRHDAVTGEVKRMWLHPGLRGLGLGRDLLDRLEREAVVLGCEAVVLDTNAVLSQALAMYAGAGYTAIERYNDNPYAHHWFRKELS